MSQSQIDEILKLLKFRNESLDRAQEEFEANGGTAAMRSVQWVEVAERCDRLAKNRIAAAYAPFYEPLPFYDEDEAWFVSIKQDIQ